MTTSLAGGVDLHAIEQGATPRPAADAAPDRPEGMRIDHDAEQSVC